MTAPDDLSNGGSPYRAAPVSVSGGVLLGSRSVRD